MSSSSFIRTAQFLLVFAMLAAGAFAQVSIVPTTGSNVLDGDPPHLLITGLRPGEIVQQSPYRQSALCSESLGNNRGTGIRTDTLAPEQQRFVAEEL